MTDWLILSGIYLVPATVVIVIYALRQSRKGHRSEVVLAESIAAGLAEPASLHPVIDYTLCLGCATCVSACPENQVLGVSENKAKLIAPASCIGHGACQSACPSNAIQLVFGTETRGVDIPRVGPDFQSNVEGIYIAGELGGMGLIRNAIEQGRQAIAAVVANGRETPAGQIDIAIIGAGPAGISAAMAAVEQGLSYRILEQDSLGGAIAHYPRGKIVMTAPATLPIIGDFQFGETSKESLMSFWHDAVEKTGIEVSAGNRVDSITATRSGFRINNDDSWQASNVLLTIGRRGTPRRLGVPGEELSKVVYRLVDPEQYQGRKVLVVGGGDSALEAALSVGAEPETEVLLSYRGGAFNRVKPGNRDRLAAALEAGTIKVELESTVENISEPQVSLQTTRGMLRVDNDAVIVCAGGILPTTFLQSLGIEVHTHFGSAL